MNYNESPLFVLLSPTVQKGAKSLPVHIYDAEFRVVNDLPTTELVMVGTKWMPSRFVPFPLVFVSLGSTVFLVRQAERVTVGGVGWMCECFLKEEEALVCSSSPDTVFLIHSDLLFLVLLFLCFCFLLLQLFLHFSVFGKLSVCSARGSMLSVLFYRMSKHVCILHPFFVFFLNLPLSFPISSPCSERVPFDLELLREIKTLCNRLPVQDCDLFRHEFFTVGNSLKHVFFMIFDLLCSSA